jgi:hypothetical protein
MVKKEADKATRTSDDPAYEQPRSAADGAAEPDPMDVRIARMAETVPVPSGITGSWFPAYVVLPGQRYQLPGKVRVYATPEGLYVYDRVPQDQAQTQQATPLWYAPIAYPETPVPPANYSARAANGFPIVTTKGTVTITVPKGCPVCGVRAMSVWQPVWAHAQLAAEWRESR